MQPHLLTLMTLGNDYSTFVHYSHTCILFVGLTILKRRMGYKGHRCEGLWINFDHMGPFTHQP